MPNGFVRAGPGRPGRSRRGPADGIRPRGEFAGRARSAKVLNARRPWPACAASRERGRCGRGSVVEHHLAKVRVAGSNPVVRSEVPDAVSRADGPHGSSVPWQGSQPERAGGGMAEWLRQGPATPCTRVRFPLPPRGRLAQRESASLTRKRSLVQSQYRPPCTRRPGRTCALRGFPWAASRCGNARTCGFRNSSGPTVLSDW